MKYILISGKAESGKDTFASALAKKLGARTQDPIFVVHFAAYLKFVAREYYGWNGLKDEYGRTLLQNIGAQARERDVEFWVNIVWETTQTLFPENSIVIIPDTRYENEITAIGDCSFFSDDDVYTVRVVRPNHENKLTPEQRQHASEVALDEYEFEHYIENVGTIADLEDSADIYAGIITGGTEWPQ